MVKLEGGGWTAPIVRYLLERGVPVCGHLGLTPQSVHALGGWRVQGRDEQAADLLRRQAVELAVAGAAILVPAALARDITATLTIPTIGIGAGVSCSGQVLVLVLVLHDMLGLGKNKPRRFVRNFMDGTGSIAGAIAAYVRTVKDGSFPDDAVHAFD